MEQKIYAMVNKSNNVLLKSSSGGVFFEIASEVLKHQGVVYGAAYNENMRVEHRRVDNENELTALLTSKYVQSKIGDAYKQVLHDLSQGKQVLFCGTPCQVAGLLNVKRMTKNLQGSLKTIDLLCHGVPSPEVFAWHVKNLENQYHSKIRSFNFRNKDKPGVVQAVKATFENGKVYSANTTQDLFYRLFSYDYVLRESCYSCKFTNMSRPADITLGDFWGYKGKMNNEKGISLVLVNTEAGEELLKLCENKFLIEKSNEKNCMQQTLQKPCEKPKSRGAVFFLWRKNSTKALQAVTNIKRIWHHFF